MLLLLSPSPPVTRLVVALLLLFLLVVLELLLALAINTAGLSEIFDDNDAVDDVNGACVIPP
jgi:hypothetical protein